ncbi:hypothetical protein [Bacteriovorax sp. DB6_IX]|uniref:hypothetical protein n=1 Tax=Bacteriovorax sp. DB6_IX TaxID=1353530 RepID=UPI000389EFAA|nr:hypothetical protein [Bacteriovorax sp. DB6_IX]EQC50476.1 hypothetical protein M901_2369 [Bacteriovorax sp. DB6_IX]
MKKWSFVLFTLALMLLTLRTQEQTRKPASLYELVGQSCQKAVTSFKSKYIYNRSRYERYYQKFLDSGTSLEKSKFKDLEEYIAWLDVSLKEHNLSLGDYFLSKSAMRNYYDKLVLNSTRPDHLSRYFFNGALEEYFKKSISFIDFGIQDQKVLKYYMAKKLADEALEKLSKTQNSRLRKYLGYAGETLSYIPLAFGMPPLKLPNFKMATERGLLDASAQDEIKAIFLELSGEDIGLLKTKIKYDQFRKYYAFSISAFYLYYTYEQLSQVGEDVDMLKKVNETMDLTISDLKEMSSPSCESIYRCLEDYKSEWENEDDELYLEYKNICHEVFEISEEC